jgi:hypothetical protein
LAKYTFYVAYNHGNGQIAGSGWAILYLTHEPTTGQDFLMMHDILEKNGAVKPTIMFFKLLSVEEEIEKGS